MVDFIRKRRNSSSIFSEIASEERDPWNLLFNGIARTRDDVLLTQGKGKGVWLYDNLKQDDEVKSALTKRHLRLISFPVEVEAGGTTSADKRAADMVKRFITELDGLNDDSLLNVDSGFDGFCLAQLDAVIKGYSVGEIMWARDGGEIRPVEIRARDARRFSFKREVGSLGWALRLLSTFNAWDGESVPARKFLTSHFGAIDGNPFGWGLGSPLYYPVFFKRNGWKFWLTFADKHGTPTVVGKYRAGTTKEQVQQLKHALASLSQDAAATIPDSMVVELLEAKRTGGDSYEKIIDKADRAIRKVILGETFTSSTGGLGSSGAAEADNQVLDDIVQADSDLLAGGCLSRLSRWICFLNRLEVTRPPRITRKIGAAKERKLKAEEQLSTANRDEILYRLGWQRSEKSVIETFGDGYERKGGPANAPQPPRVQ
jgi:phage gp29-like protein